MSPDLPQAKDTYNRQRIVFTVLGSLIAGSLVFWPLLTAVSSIVLFVYWLFVADKRFKMEKGRLALLILFVLMYLLAIIGTFYSANTDEAWFKLQQQSALALFPLVFATAVAVNTTVCHHIFLAFAWFTLAGCMACLGYGVFHFISSGSPESLHGYSLVILKDMSPFMLGLYCLLSVLYLVGAVYRGVFRQGRERTTYVVVLLVLSAFLFLLGNRNVLFSWILVVIFYLLMIIRAQRVRFAFFALLVGILTAAAVLNPSFRKQLKDLSDFSDTNTIQLDNDRSLGRGWGGKAIRFAIWKCSMDIVREHGLTGVGTGDVQDSLQAAYDRRKFYFASQYNTYNAHNQFLQAMLAYGVAGILVFSACLLVPFIMFFRSLRLNGTHWYRQLYCLFLVSFLIICLTESILEISKGIVFYSFFNSIFAFILTSQPQNQRTDGTKASSIF